MQVDRRGEQPVGFAPAHIVFGFRVHGIDQAVRISLPRRVQRNR
jgi:hypothetical protein